MTSVERSLSYSGIKPEPYIPKKITPAPSGWPQYGIITYEGVSVKYGQDAPKALRNIWCCIRAQEKVRIFLHLFIYLYINIMVNCMDNGEGSNVSSSRW